MLAEIAKLPKGTWRNAMTIDGYDEPITLQRHRHHLATPASTSTTPAPSPASRRGINVPLAYTTAYTVFGLGCVVARAHPQQRRLARAAHRVGARGHASSTRRKPAPCASRHIIGQMLPDVVFGCLRQVIPERVPAEGTSCLWNINVRGRVKGGEGGNYGFAHGHHLERRHRRAADKDGLSATAYPSGVRGTPVEIAETQHAADLLAQGAAPRLAAAPAARAAGSARSSRSRAASTSRSSCWPPSTASTSRRAAATAGRAAPPATSASAAAPR